MSNVNHTAARLLFRGELRQERMRIATRMGSARPWADAAAHDAGGVYPVSPAFAPKTGEGISRGDPAPR